MSILYLDIDGVLNSHDPHPNGYCGIHADKVLLLNRIVQETDCGIILSSAWRYMILRGEMTLKGFGYLLMIHGATRMTADALTGTLPEDGNPADLHDRAKLVTSYWHKYHKYHNTTRVVALDDLDLGYTYASIPFVKTDGSVGLTAAGADEVIRLLNGDR